MYYDIWKVPKYWLIWLLHSAMLQYDGKLNLIFSKNIRYITWTHEIILFVVLINENKYKCDQIKMYRTLI